MARRSRVDGLNEQLNEAVDALMADRPAPDPALDPRIAELLRVAADLRHLPRDGFKARLKADLQRATVIHVQAIPTGYHSATPCLVVKDPSGAIEFYKRAFGATEAMRLADPEGAVVHAEIKIGDSLIALAPEAPQWGNLSPQALGGSPVIVQLYVEDVDALATQAVAAGARVIFPVADQFYGDRAGRLADPFGHVWIVGTHKEDVSVDEMRQRMLAYASSDTGAEAPEATPSAAVIQTVRPHLQVEGAAKLIDFLRRAFQAEEIVRSTRPDGSIAHAEVRIEDSTIEMGDVTAEHGANPAAIHLYVENTDAVYRRALLAGATSMEEPADQDYGERSAGVKDPFGNHWYMATPHTKSKGPLPHVPDGLRSVTPYLHPHGAPRLIDFLERAFGAQEVFRAQSEGVVHHAKVKVGDLVIEMGEAHGPYQPMPSALHLHVDDTDAVYQRALRAGAASVQAPIDRPWGQRSAGVKDEFGTLWWIGAPLHEVKPEPAVAAEAAPPGYRSVTPYLVVPEALKLMDFLKQAFGATEVMRSGDPSSHFHAEVKIGDSIIMMGNAGHGTPATAAQTYLYVPDVDRVYQRALQAGATSMQEPTDQDYGDRNAFVKDPFGNLWYIATHKKDLH